MFKCHNIFVVKSRSGWTECTLPETDFTMYVFQMKCKNAL